MIISNGWLTLFNPVHQIRINSFLQRPRVWDRPILIQLRPSTYRAYRQVWQRLICFAYRTSRPNAAVQLGHQLTTAQLAALDRMETAAAELLSLPSPPLCTPGPGAADHPPWTTGGGPWVVIQTPRGGDRDRDPEGDRRTERRHAAYEQLDHACLDLSIALLDHPLKGDLFESAVVAFLAVLGVDVEKQTFRDPYAFTSSLSGLIKMAQMLVAQRAVQMADHGQVEHPADALEAMRERFLLPGVAAPFNWLTRLRTFGKRIQNTTTSLGYIYWSDDQQTLSYKELHLTMAGLRGFVRTQVELAQLELEGLFLLHEEETREAVVPRLALVELADDPTNNRRGWNFLQDHRTRAALPTTGEQWLMDRVVATDWLRAEWVGVRPHDHQVMWHTTVVDAYLGQVDQFLERLLLLMHLTAGQPARATELLGIRHSNTVCGQHRNLFIEHGVVSLVTAYHKGYSMTGSTKIIHRYLPAEVSELVVYYLWLILPFARAVQALAHGTRQARSPFLWPRGPNLAAGAWDSGRLRGVLQREAHIHLQTKLNVISWRHAAIAISRAHLQCGGFKRDYSADDGLIDQQAGHGSWAAGTVYARGLQEAPGHIQARRVQYRAISREWHAFLGFQVSLGPRKRGWGEGKGEEPAAKRQRQQRPYVTVEMKEN